ncbi:hypothetical protein [Aquabacterium sp. UBA2148]|uniref:hypothetical protein n=1 Tax=Aquabacterium sp. UBA2148 TaxID=1946042 RepID=UPI00257C1108|nr:hypothetical protein [Aquabacterium sp. UBA2148]
MVQKLTALLCLAWLVGSPWWSSAMDRDPNGLALLLALLALSWWGAHRWRQRGVRPNWLVRVLLWCTTLFVGFQVYAVLVGNLDFMNQVIKAAPPGSLERYLAVFVPGTLVAVLYAAMLAYPLWAVFGPWQLVLTAMVFAFVRFVQAPYTVFDAPRTLGDKVAMTELALCVMVMALVVAVLQWRLGRRGAGRMPGRCDLRTFTDRWRKRKGGGDE